MKLKKLLRYYAGEAELQVRDNKKTLLETKVNQIFAGYPLDAFNYFILERKVISYDVVKGNIAPVKIRVLVEKVGK